MKVSDINIQSLVYAPWNSNIMDPEMLDYLRESINRYGLTQNLVVRPASNEKYEVLSGNQRLTVLKEMGISPIPCVIVNLDDPHARLLAQALNHIHGDDDLGLRAELIRNVLDKLPESNILSLLPLTPAGLNAIAGIGTEPISSYLTNWQQAQAFRLRRLQFRLTPSQLIVVEKAIAKLMPEIDKNDTDNPNRRGNALFLLCRYFLNSEEKNAK